MLVYGLLRYLVTSIDLNLLQCTSWCDKYPCIIFIYSWQERDSHEISCLIIYWQKLHYDLDVCIKYFICTYVHEKHKTWPFLPLGNYGNTFLIIGACYLLQLCITTNLHSHLWSFSVIFGFFSVIILNYLQFHETSDSQYFSHF